MNLKKYRRSILAVVDIVILIVVFCGLFVCLPIENGTNSRDLLLLLPSLTIFICFSIIFQTLLHTYDSLWRYAEGKEYLLLFTGSGLSYICYYFLDTFVLKSGISHLFSAAMIAFSFTGMLLLRFFYRMFRIRQGIRTNPEAKEYVAIIGAGDAGVRLMEEIRHSSTSPYIPYCFVDDSVEKIGKFIHGIEIKGPVSNLEELLKNSPVSNVIVAVPSMLLADKRRILSICSELKYHTQILPEFTQFIEQGNFSAVLREVEIDDLLGREAVNFGNKEVADFIHGKIVMVTGGGGSIGSELCRQIAAVSPKQLIIVDIYENNAYAIQQELMYQYKDTLHLNVEIASVRDKKKVDYLFAKYQPQIVIHAAAHKHVPLMENAPEEALKNNVKGTYNVVHAADKYHAEKFILISTDKAVNPTNVMGASKRLCEMILQSMKNVSQTTYVAVRFGNVLGSNGSVIPLFKEQIAHGGPITITDKRIVRYFMTIAEASQLVLQAGAIADSSQIYVLDMGEPVKILELAENLIKLSGYVPYKEIPIVEVGLRPGEKLYEELLMSSEELTDTFHHKIFIEQQQEILPQEMEQKIEILRKAVNTGTIKQIKLAMKEVVPTYRSPQEVNEEAILKAHQNEWEQEDQ